MVHRGDHVTLTGHGYVRVRYEIAWFNRPGDLVMPTWTGLEGQLGGRGDRYGLTRDDGTDDAPVPQYLTRGHPLDPATVRRLSRLSPAS